MDRIRREISLRQRVHLNNHNSSTYKHIKPIHTYIAWVYESTGSGSGSDSAEWTLDDVRIK
jgi:hypothetical protein